MAKLFLVPIDLNTNEVRNAVVQNLASPPTGIAGRIYYDTADSCLKWYNGSSWICAKGAIDSVAGTLPIVVNTSGGVATVSINAATGSNAGSMSAADKTKLDAATSNNTNSTIMMRDGSGNVNISDPISASHAATKKYVDDRVNGIDWKESVKVATTANITLSGTQTIDGIAVVANDRVLVKNQNTAAQNGIYVVAAGAWSRATDANNGTNVTPNLTVLVEQGTAGADTVWTLTTDTTPIVVDTTALAFTQISGAGQIVAGAGMTKTNNTLDVIAGDTSITVNADDIRVNVDNSTIVVSSGIRVQGYTFVSGATVARKYTATSVSIGTTPGVQTVTHNLNTRDVNVRVYDTATNEDVEVDIIRTTVNAVTVQGTGATRTCNVVVIG